MDPSLPEPNPIMILPFVVLLGSIALGPLYFPGKWHRHYPAIALGLGAVTLLYYLGALSAYGRVWEVFHEYFSFIALVGSLFIVSGGIHITVKGEATPRVNVLFLLCGAIISNVLGTTGASMLLIRPWMRMNKYRLTAFHIVFFIFIVSNLGGCLTPIGDPPLFLGYLKGVPFWWVARECWLIWLTAIGVLLLIFYILDRENYGRAPKEVRATMAEPPDQWRFEGLLNLIFLAAILGAVFIHNPPFIRENIMVLAAFGSYFTTRRSVHEANDFNFLPVKEVAILFAGIFATMMPALDWLQGHAKLIGTASPGMFYWSCGSLSSVLDNAPTYLSFLSALFGLYVDQTAIEQVRQLMLNPGAVGAGVAEQSRAAFLYLQQNYPQALASGQIGADQIKTAFLLANGAYAPYLVAISVGAVFFGAATYIGNGPNFMVKSIAEHSKAHIPSFLGYIWRFTLPCLLPVLILVWLLFLK